MTVADHIALWIAEKGISHAFGLTGAGNLALWDAIGRLGKTRLICTHHEQAAAISAPYFNRTCGSLKAIALVTTGAGSSNTITGVMSAYMDSVPLIVISGNEPLVALSADTRVLGTQGYDASGLAIGFCKEVARLNRWDKSFMDLLYTWATKPRQGPVWVDCPRDVATSEVK